MKAVVVEIKNKYAAILSDDGCVSKIKNNNYVLGQTIEVHKQTASLYRKISFSAAAAAAFVMLGTGAWAYASPYSYVSMDVNPSIEFTMNRFDRVIDVKADNDDGEKLLNDTPVNSYVNKSITEAVTDTIMKISDAGYFEEGENDIIITTASKSLKKADALANNLKKAATLETSKSGEKVDVEAVRVELERVKEAKDLGVTPGKLNLVDKLKKAANDPESIDEKEWLDKPVKDIIKATKELKSKTKEKAELGNKERTAYPNSEKIGEKPKINKPKKTDPGSIKHETSRNKAEKADKIKAHKKENPNLKDSPIAKKGIQNNKKDTAPGKTDNKTKNKVRNPKKNKEVSKGREKGSIRNSVKDHADKHGKASSTHPKNDKDRKSSNQARDKHSSSGKHNNDKPNNAKPNP